MPMPKKGPVFLGIFGHVNVDWIVDERRKPPVKHGPYFGGVAGNIAVGASRFGVPVRLGSVIGRNFPELYLKRLKDLNVDLDFLQWNNEIETSSCQMTNTADGGQLKEICHGPHNAGVRMPAKFVEGLKYLHVSTGLPESCISVARLGHEHGCSVTFDPGADLKRHYDQKQLTEALSYSDTFEVNSEELDVALGLLEERSYKGLRKYVGTIIITKAQKGSILIGPRSEWSVPAIKVRNVVDQTGAGDAYRSGFYAGLFRGWPKCDCCQLGAIAASECIKKDGAQEGLQSWSELERLFYKNKR